MNTPLSIAFLLAAGASLSLTACARAVTVEGGAAGSTSAGGTGAAGGTGGSGGVTTTTTSTGPCTKAEDCTAMSDACNTGACINGECGKLPANNGSPCEDGKTCTQNDTCQQGICVGGPLTVCPSMGPCSVGQCDVATDTCIQVPGNNGGFCNLGDPCVTLAACLNGVCQPQQIKDCSYLNTVCGTGTCDPQLGCVATPQNDGTPCNDYLFCTVGDQCVSGQCKGVPNVCGVPNGDPCKTGICNEASQSCQVVAGNDGASCDDGNVCTSGEKCQSGTCVGGAPANNGATCDDQNGCTGGTTCENGICTNPSSQIVACVDGDMCCPAGCANDKDCLYWATGVQNNVPVASLTGWSQCYLDGYDSYSSLSTILQQCDKSKLLLACRTAGSSVLDVVAMAPRADVTWECGSQSNCSHAANGVGWYYSDSYSWGFAPENSPVNRNSCDIVDSQSYPGGGASDGAQRICWHTSSGSISSGWRCGKPDFLSNSYERLIFEAD